jgi:hypothetical protein
MRRQALDQWCGVRCGFRPDDAAATTMSRGVRPASGFVGERKRRRLPEGRGRDADARSDLTERRTGPVGRLVGAPARLSAASGSCRRSAVNGVGEAAPAKVPPVVREMVEPVAEAPATTLPPRLGQVLEALAEPAPVQLLGTVIKQLQACAEPPDMRLVANGLVRGLLVGFDVTHGGLPSQLAP